MKPNELMIGDWVQVPCLIDNVEHYDAWCKVKQLRDCDLDVIGFKELKYNEIMPIPLTAEILEKNGFKKQYGNDWCYYKYKDDDTSKESLYLILYGIDSLYLEIAAFTNASGEYNRMGVCYVHELQHALRLCNIDKEIEI